MKAASQFCLTVVVVIILAVLVGRSDHALDAQLPNDMPPGAHFLASGWDITQNEPKGDWVFCREDSEQAADWCRVTDARGVVVYEGEFLPTSQTTPVASGQLVIASVNPNQMWVQGPAEQQPVPVISLANHQTLVPVADREALVARWSEQPDELARVSGAR